MRKNKHFELEGDVGFQIAPMLDVIFVIMLFFMSLATDKVVETQLTMTLPSTEPPVDSMQDTPMEETIAIDAEGQITHNEEPVTTNELKATFKNLKDQSTAEGNTPIIVTISAQVEQVDNRVKVPVAPDSTERKPDKNQALLNVIWNEKEQKSLLNYSGTDYEEDFEPLVTLLKARAEGNDKFEVIIRSDKNTPAKEMSAVIAVVSQATAKVAFATVNKAD